MYRILPIAILLVSELAVVTAFGEEVLRVDFNRDIRPILSDKCFQCHGPDEENLKAGLQLSVRESAVEAGAIRPGDAASSELLSRVLSDDPEEVMPPPKIKKPVSEKEAKLLRQWIEGGAEYKGHWAFQPVVKPSTPTVARDALIKNDIDRFILSRLEEEGIEISDEADPRTLARRLSLDLVGLLPAPERV